MKKVSRTAVFLVVICAFLLAVTVSLGFVLTRQSSAAMRTLIENRMLDVSKTAAALLDGDTLEKLEAEDKDTPEYQEAYRMLSRFEDNIELEYIYCVRDLGDGNFVFMIDPDAEAPGEFGEHIPYTDALYQASLGTAAVDSVPYEDAWGRFYSAYSPVFDSAGAVAGIVAVDFSADWYERQIDKQVHTTLIISGISLFFAGVVIALITTRFRRRFLAMLNQMNAVSDGIETLVRELSPDIEIHLHQDGEENRSTDEITALGDRLRSLENQLGEEIAFVRSQAYVDGLTGLSNRTAYNDVIEQLNGEIGAGSADFAVAVIDLNGLKQINDQRGHDQGDRAIVKVAAALQKIFGSDRLYRIGGDEFIVIRQGAEADLAAKLKDIDAALGHDEAVSVAKGCAAYAPDTDSSYREVFERADNAMYSDKKAYYMNHNDRRKH